MVRLLVDLTEQVDKLQDQLDTDLGEFDFLGKMLVAKEAALNIKA